jgi:23S rRNA (adenine-N6)-dimethyltransferase
MKSKTNNYYRSNQRDIRHSQNFIKRSELVTELLNLTSINNDDTVIEIGPGRGIITSQLVNKCKKVIALEKDKVLSADLKTKLFSINKNVEIFDTDFLNWLPPCEPYKLISNIPFNYTSDIIQRITNFENSPIESYLILQDKAAYRYIGQPYISNTLISILLKYKFHFSIIKQIPNYEFTPKPNISCVFLKISLLSNPLIRSETEQIFRDFICYGFSQWQPTVILAFKKIFSPNQTKLILNSIPLLNKMKPSEVSFNDWLYLFEIFLKYVGLNKKQLVLGSELRMRNQQAQLVKKYRTR